MTWGPILTPEQASVLNNQVDSDIPAAISTYESGREAVEEYIEQLRAIKELHEIFYNWFHNDVVTQYESEWRWLVGEYISLPLIEQDIADAVNFNPDARLFPRGWAELEPKYIDVAKGMFDSYEYGAEWDLTAVARAAAIALRDGLNGSGSDQTTQIINHDTVSISVVDGLQFTIGNYVVLAYDISRAVFVVTDTFASSISVNVVAFSGGEMGVGNKSISERSATQLSFMNDTLLLINYAMNQQLASLNNNLDDITYEGVHNDIVDAIADTQATIINYLSWTTYAQLVLFIDTRSLFVFARRDQIYAATKTPDVGAYDRRFAWLTDLVHRNSGSAVMLSGAESSIVFFDSSIEFLQQQSDDLKEWRDG